MGGVLKNSNKVKTVNDLTPQEWISETEELILSSKNITILKNTLVTTYNFTNHLIALEDKFAGKKIDLNRLLTFIKKENFFFPQFQNIWVNNGGDNKSNPLLRNITEESRDFFLRV